MSASSSSSAVVASGSSGRSSAASSGVAVSSAASLDPAGYLRGAAGESVFSLSTPSDGSDRGAYEAQAWERAKAQAAGVAQTGFTLYMFVGNQLALFNLIFLFTFGMQPIANLLATGKSACAAAVACAAAGFAPGPRPRCAAASTYPFFFIFFSPSRSVCAHVRAGRQPAPLQNCLRWAQCCWPGYCPLEGARHGAPAADVGGLGVLAARARCHGVGRRA